MRKARRFACRSRKATRPRKISPRTASDCDSSNCPTVSNSPSSCPFTKTRRLHSLRKHSALHKMHIPSTEPPDPPNPKPTTTHTNGASANPPATAPPETPQLSGAELKKRAKAEKAAKRAAEKAAKPSAPAQQPQQKDGRQKSKESKAPAVQQANGEASRGAGAQQQHHKRTGSVNAASLVQRPALGATKRRPSQGGPVKEVEKKKVESKQREVAVFGHLYGQPRRHSIEGAAKEVHPAVLALGLQMSSYVVCGSNARCVAMLLAFKSVSLLRYKLYSTVLQ